MDPQATTPRRREAHNSVKCTVQTAPTMTFVSDCLLELDGAYERVICIVDRNKHAPSLPVSVAGLDPFQNQEGTHMSNRPRGAQKFREGKHLHLDTPEDSRACGRYSDLLRLTSTRNQCRTHRCRHPHETPFVSPCPDKRLALRTSFQSIHDVESRAIKYASAQLIRFLTHVAPPSYCQPTFLSNYLRFSSFCVFVFDVFNVGSVV